MEKNSKNIIKFEMSNGNKFVFYKLHVIVGQYLSGMLFIFLIIQGVVSKQSLTYNIIGSMAIPAVLSILSLLLYWKVKNARVASSLIVDNEKREFSAYIYDTKKEVKFGVNDITEVDGSPEMFRFCLKDGTWVSWVKDNISWQFLEEIIKSFGFSIKDKKLW